LRIINKHILGNLIRKNQGNIKLIKTIEQLVADIENNSWKTPRELLRLDQMQIVFTEESSTFSTLAFTDL
jgi:hypothetical protein